jgi:hypothetical protein
MFFFIIKFIKKKSNIHRFNRKFLILSLFLNFKLIIFCTIKLFSKKKKNLEKKNINKYFIVHEKESWKFNVSWSFKQIFKQFFKHTSYIWFLVQSNLESTLTQNYGVYKYWQHLIFKNFILSLLPENFTIFNKKLSNLYLLHTNETYKGWRHFFNLPVRGQRTWSNGKTSSKLFNHLKQFNYCCSAKKYDLKLTKPTEMILFAEYVNFFWATEWTTEWNSAFNANKHLFKKNNYQKFKINYQYLNNFQIKTPLTSKTAKKKKKEVLTIGFPFNHMINLITKKKK